MDRIWDLNVCISIKLLCYTPETNTMLYVNYSSIKDKTLRLGERELLVFGLGPVLFHWSDLVLWGLSVSLSQMGINIFLNLL